MSNEWALVDRLIAERDRLAEALREARKWVGIYCVPGTLKADMDAALAECAGTPRMELDEQLKSLIEGAKREAVAEYKKGLALVVYEYPAGCEGGKRQFLSELDIEWPYASYQTEVHIRALNDGNVQAVMRQIESDLQRNYDTDSITVNVGSWESVDDEDY